MRQAPCAIRRDAAVSAAMPAAGYWRRIPGVIAPPSSSTIWHNDRQTSRYRRRRQPTVQPIPTGRSEPADFAGCDVSPDHPVIASEVLVGHEVPHANPFLPRDLGVVRDDLRIAHPSLPTSIGEERVHRLSQHDHAEEGRIDGLGIVRELGFGHAGHMVEDSLGGGQDILDALSVVTHGRLPRPPLRPKRGRHHGGTRPPRRRPRARTSRSGGSSSRPDEDR